MRLSDQGKATILVSLAVTFGWALLQRLTFGQVYIVPTVLVFVLSALALAIVGINKGK